MKNDSKTLNSTTIYPGRVIDPETNPRVMYHELDEKKYKSEIELFDRWQSFSAEMLRLSLLGIAIFGFLLKEVFIRGNDPTTARLPINPAIRDLSKYSVACFAITTVCALIYRYAATEALLHFFHGLKNPGTEKARLKKRRRLLIFCLVVKSLGAFSLAVGAVLAASAIFKVLN